MNLVFKYTLTLIYTYFLGRITIYVLFLRKTVFRRLLFKFNNNQNQVYFCEKNSEIYNI